MSRRPRRHHGGNCPSCGDIMQPSVSSTVSTIAQSAKKDEREKESNDKEPADVLWSVNEAAEAQMKDPDISCVIEHLSKGKEKPSKKELQSKSPMTKSIWAKFELLELKDGVLHIRPTTNKKEWTSRIILPQSIVQPALKRVHDGIEGGHLGTFKSLYKLQARFWRPGLSSSVYDYVQSYLTCGQCKPPPNTPKAELMSIPSSHPMQRVHIDIIGPLPRTKKGNSYIMTVQCAYTKWAEAYPLRNQRASTCARVLINDWIYRYGVPDSIHTDQGTNFESNLFQEMCDVLEIKKTRTTPYHPAGNGQVENFKRTLKSLLKVRVTENTNTWDEHLGACLMAYRSSIHKSTCYTPFHLMFGREIRLPLDIMLGEEIKEEEESYGEFATVWLRKIFPKTVFVSTDMPDKRIRVAKSQEELDELEDDSTDIYKSNIIERYSIRPNYISSANNMCLAEFAAYYYKDYKTDIAETADAQPEVLNDNMIEQGHRTTTEDTSSFPNKIRLLNGTEVMKCRKVKAVIRYHTPSKSKEAEKYFHHLLMLYYPWREETELLCDQHT